jgi:hypothetical protein
VVRRASGADLGDRFLTALEMNADLAPVGMAHPEEVGAWVRRTAAVRLAERRTLIERSAAGSPADGKPMAEVLSELESSDRTQWEAPPSLVETGRRGARKRWLALALPVVVLGIGAPVLWARSRHAPAAVATVVATAPPSFSAPAVASSAATSDLASLTTPSASAPAAAPTIRPVLPVPQPRGVARPGGTSRQLDPKSYR